MSSAFDSIVYGPFITEYHRKLVDDAFKRTFVGFLDRNLLPQVDHEFASASGALTAAYNEDRYCGPNSLVRDCFRFQFTFNGSKGHSRIKTELEYSSKDRQFEVRRGRSLYLWTPQRQRKRQSEQEAIQQIVNGILDGSDNQSLCPLCHAKLMVVNNSWLFDVVCPNRCFKYNFHKNQDGQPLHGHFFIDDPKGDA